MKAVGLKPIKFLGAGSYGSVYRISKTRVAKIMYKSTEAKIYDRLLGLPAAERPRMLPRPVTTIVRDELYICVRELLYCLKKENLFTMEGENWIHWTNDNDDLKEFFSELANKCASKRDLQNARKLRAWAKQTGFVARDLFHHSNWGIRPSTGELVIRDLSECHFEPSRPATS